MSDVKTYIGKQVYVQVSGKDSFNGILTDVGKDILVLFDGQRFLYIPLVNIHRIQLNTSTDEQVNQPSESSFSTQMESLTHRDVLTNAHGRFTEIYVAGNITFHGYITSVLNDYFTFYSPFYKEMLISLNHLKWLSPYNQSFIPFSSNKDHLPIALSNVPPLPLFGEQLKSKVGSLVVLDGGTDSIKMGLLQKVQGDLVELSLASGESLLLNLTHIKSVQMP